MKKSATMQIRYVGGSRKAMGITAPGSDTTYQFDPGEPFTVPPEDGEAILSAFPRLFEEVKSRPAPKSEAEDSPAEDDALSMG